MDKKITNAMKMTQKGRDLKNSQNSKNYYDILSDDNEEEYEEACDQQKLVILPIAHFEETSDQKKTKEENDEKGK